MSIVRLAARPLLATSFVATGIDRLRHAEETAASLRPLVQQTESVFPAAGALAGQEKTIARVIGAAQVGAGVLLGMGKFSRLAAALLAGTTAVNTLVEYRAADSTTPEARRDRRNRLLKNLSLAGAVMLAAVDTAGKPGLVWRAEHLAADARRNVRSISRGARRNAASMGKDARKQLKKAERTVREATADVVGS
ncbi:DoxX family protein [Arthrobacter sp. CAU 1506]|uniref:DoxX family protein n=1 Tax=Arthrobacter sp. CAU 1506 TaxID=2560052 RepID=UPI0010AB5236|nr:DoxX family protein [Arthrobacter sp. CAU 1506]TJY71220.1 DoxX family protein [Arthrobacter sp. CAU 1506]